MSNNLLIKITDNASKDFELLVNDPRYLPARKMLDAIPQSFIDKDRTFRKLFQQEHFNRFFWEIALYKVFIESGFQFIESNHESPDLIIEKNGIVICVEATSTNSTDGDILTPQILAEFDDIKEENKKSEHGEYLMNQYSFKICNSLCDKLKKEYWKKDWIKGKPIVLAINTFHNDIANKTPDSLIVEFLYKWKTRLITDSWGNERCEYTPTEAIIFNKKTRPTGFFYFEKAENISAVVFNNELPLYKFCRMGYNLDDKEKIKIIREGKAFGEINEIDYHYDLSHRKEKEKWNEGFSVFHNPNAKIPLDKSLFEGFRQLWLNEEGRYDGEMPDFLPYTSNTIIECI